MQQAVASVVQNHFIAKCRFASFFLSLSISLFFILRKEERISFPSTFFLKSFLEKEKMNSVKIVKK